MSPMEGEQAIWSVTMPSEVVLHCDILANHSFERFGKVLSVADLNETSFQGIQVQYEDKESAFSLQQYLVGQG